MANKKPGARTVAIGYNEIMCKHEQPGDHRLPLEDRHMEKPTRLTTVWERLVRRNVTTRCDIKGGAMATEEELARVHTLRHINSIRSSAYSERERSGLRKELKNKDKDVYINKHSMQAASFAAGTTIMICRLVATGCYQSGLALVRPPGHHAGRDGAEGFCIFNNIAVAASDLLANVQGINKILIVDWDVHHGNGTQHIFYDDPRVLFFSVHRYDNAEFYPFSEDANFDRIGSGAGLGYNINVPLSKSGFGDADYMSVWDHVLIPVVKIFKPDIILISGGFDAADYDKVGGYHVTPNGFALMLEKLMPFAGGKVVLVLEGGYELRSLADSYLHCTYSLLGEKVTVEENGSVSAETKSIIKKVRRQLFGHWEILGEVRFIPTGSPYINMVLNLLFCFKGDIMHECTCKDECLTCLLDEVCHEYQFEEIIDSGRIASNIHKFGHFTDSQEQNLALFWQTALRSYLSNAKYQIHIHQEITCACKKRFESDEMLTVIELSLNETSETLLDCLRSYMDGVVSEYNCPSCSRKQYAARRINFQSLPFLLSIRIQHSDEGGISTLDKDSFPEVIDARKYFKIGGITYDLVGSVHFNSDKKEEFACCVKVDGEFYKITDKVQIVTKRPCENVSMLLYKRNQKYGFGLLQFPVKDRVRNRRKRGTLISPKKGPSSLANSGTEARRHGVSPKKRPSAAWSTPG